MSLTSFKYWIIIHSSINSSNIFLHLYSISFFVQNLLINFFFFLVLLLTYQINNPFSEIFDSWISFEMINSILFSLLLSTISIFLFNFFFIILKNNLANPLLKVKNKVIKKVRKQTDATDDIDYPIVALPLITERKN